MSRVPLEQMIASLRPDCPVPKSGTSGAVSWTVMTVPLSHAAARLGESRHVGHLLGGLGREELEEPLDGGVGVGAEPAQRRGLALGEVVLAPEPQQRPVLVGELYADL